MVNLEKRDKRKLEKLFEMETGYVLDFSNKTIEAFVLDSIDVDIYDKRYSSYGESKANRLRRLWDILDTAKLKKLLNELIDRKIELEEEKKERKEMYGDDYDIDYKLIETCRAIVDNLSGNQMTEKADELNQIVIPDKSVDMLMKSIKENIENKEPELAMDRLHTFAVKYIRSLCTKYQIQFDRNKPLHSCYGEYIKYLDKNGLIEAELTKKIFKYSISIFDSYNYVRNNQSYAHDNEVLNYQESKLIFNSISSILVFIDSIEQTRKLSK